MFINLLNNAVKYTEPRGESGSRFSLKRAPSLFECETLASASTRVAAAVFDLFTQASRSARSLAGRLGVGYAVRRLIEMHGGRRFRRLAMAWDAASEFVVRLPALPDDVTLLR